MSSMTPALRPRPLLGTARPRRNPWLVALACAGLCLNGCGAAGDESAARAGSYFEAMHAASSPQLSNLARFAAADAAFDMQGLDEAALLTGRPGIAQLLREDWGEIPVSLTTDEPPYVSATGAIDPSRLAWESFAVPQAPVQQMSVDGFQDYVWHGSVTAGASYVGLDPEPLDTLAAAYVAAWAGGGAESINGLYARGAALSDSLLGIDLADVSARTAAQSADLDLRGAALRTIPDNGGAAIYGLHDWVDGRRTTPTSVVLLLDVPGADDCPGQVGVHLSLDAEGRVTREERFHRVDAVDRCFDLAGLDPWWHEIAVPDPEAMPVRTGVLSQRGKQIQLWDATEAREQLLQWALGRFADGMLPPPELRSITFTPVEPDPWTTYGFVPGSSDIPLPGTAGGCPEQGCSRWPAESRATALTALAHYWLADPAWRHLREEYADAIGKAWTDASTDGSRYPPLGPAAHRAAHTITWGLMDEPYPLPDDIADLSCDQLSADFVALTAASPAGAACSPEGGP